MLNVFIIYYTYIMRSKYYNELKIKINDLFTYKNMLNFYNTIISSKLVMRYKFKVKS